MIIRTFLIAGGNATALVQDCPAPRRASLAADLLREVEQVGFVDHQAHPPRLEMMGGEFCINATLAFASTLGPRGTVGVSGLDRPVDYGSTAQTTRVTIPLRWSLTDNIVLLEGIGFVLSPRSDNRHPLEALDHARNKRALAGLCSRYNLPAFGAIHFADDAITPYVYVAAVDSYVPETACGSGSVAFSLFTGQSRVRQPTGQVITVGRHEERKGKETGFDVFDVEALIEQTVSSCNSGKGVALCPGSD